MLQQASLTLRTSTPPRVGATTITVVCAADDHYAMPLAVTLKSAVRTLPSGARIRLFLLADSLSDTNRKRINDTLAGDPIDITVIAPDRNEVSNLKVSHHISHAAYFRLLAAELLPADVDKAIYLDSDLLVRGSLLRLWEKPLGENYCLASVDVACPRIDARVGCANYRLASPYLASIRPIKNYRELDLDGASEYFNSGVMVLNLARWRRENVAERLLRTLRDNKKYVWCWDQYALNVVFHGQWGRLEPRWNQGAHLFDFPSEKHSPIDRDEFRTAKLNPAIIHFTTDHKPWHAHTNHPRAEVFYQGLVDTAWRDWNPRSVRLDLRTWLNRQMARLIKHSAISSWKLAVALGW